MNIKTLCKTYNLGELKSTEKLTGGLMHKMYKVETTKDTYCIKELNSEVMSRDTAYNNFIISEQISNLANENKLPVSNALLIDNKYLLKQNNNYYMVFKYIEGKTLKDEEITTSHCQKIGKILASIHNLDYTKINLKENIIKTSEYYEWKDYIKSPNFNNMSYKELYLTNYNKYYSLLSRAVERYNDSNTIQTICHCDMDPKNVMWSNDKPIIIDWESSTMSNPNIELLEVALNWSGFLSNNFNSEKFLSVFKSYFKIRQTKDVDWYSIICGNLIGRFNWLNYNLKRSLHLISTTEEESTLAENEVTKTINEINNYLELIGQLDDLISNLNKTKKDNKLIELIINNNKLLHNQNYSLINAGFTNTIYKINNKYIVRICTNPSNEERFLTEINFYKENKDNKYIPTMYLCDTTKQIIPYYYEVIELIKGDTIYDIWYKLSKKEREEIIKKVSLAIKSIHQIKPTIIDYKSILKDKLSILNNKDLLTKIDIYFKEEHLVTCHNDLHFDNIIIDEQNNIRIIDFERISTNPLDYDFFIFNECISKPWKWASSKTDMLTVEQDYKDILNLFKKYYKELNNIDYLVQRLSIYKILDLLKQYLNTQDKVLLTEINDIIDNLK